jgi:hypothetical protein
MVRAKFVVERVESEGADGTTIELRAVYIDFTPAE